MNIRFIAFSNFLALFLVPLTLKFPTYCFVLLVSATRPNAWPIRVATAIAKHFLFSLPQLDHHMSFSTICISSVSIRCIH